MRKFIVNSLVVAVSVNFAAPIIAQKFSHLSDEEQSAIIKKRIAKQNAALAKWTSEQQGEFTVHIPPSSTSKVITYTGEAVFNSPKNLEAFQRLYVVAEAACPGFSAVPLDKSNIGASKSIDTEKNFCSLDASRSTRIVLQNGQLMTTPEGSPFVFMLLLNPKDDKDPADREVGVMRLAGRLMSQMTPLISPDGTPVPAAVINGDNKATNIAETSGKPVAAGAATSPASLKAAMDAIPRANRPIGMAMKEGEWDSYKMMVEYTAMVLFPGGVAIPASCRNWNPQKAPGSNMGCGITRYALSSGRVTFSGDKEPADLADFKGFAAGKSISVNMGNVGGGGASTYGSSISQVSGGELVMTTNGDISSGDWVANSIQGGNYSGYAGSNTKGVTGKYYLDGFLVAVQDKAGQISIGFIGEKIESSDRYIYLNGEQFWK